MSKAYIKRDLAVGKYYADVDGGGGGGGSSYSTTETATGGKWVNGETVYQKSFEITLPAAFDISNGFVIEADASYIDKLLGADCFVKNPSGYLAGVGMNADGWKFAIHRGADNKLILYSAAGAQLYSGTAFITIKYTKTV